MLIAGKDGYLRSVALATFTQNWQTAVTTIANAAAPITTAGTHYCPWGGVLWNGAAYSPQTGLAYVNAIDWCTTVQLAATPQPYVPGELWTGSANGFGVRDAAKSGWLNAIDATTGGVRWRFHSTTPLVAGVTPTAGGLVITGDLAGNVLVFNATTGALLATVPTNKALGGGIISYEVKGKQYIAVAAGMASSNFATPNVAPSLIVIGR
jgi:alcohol dehydrogenase (cytochrome c)